MVWSKIALDKSQLSKTDEVKSDSVKSVSFRLQLIKLVFFIFCLLKEARLRLQSLKSTENRNSLQVSKCSPSSLHDLNFASLNDVEFSFARLRLQLVKVQSENFIADRSASAKLQLTKEQDSESQSGKTC